MVEYLVDFVLVAVLVIGLTATMGVLANAIGINVFGGKKKSAFVDQSQKTQVGWKKVKRS
ncbi:hypothetical protein ACFFIX_10995 [Metabacillus herbersteinensis]|uniref:Uncharacterized protein n=1 Tax=Metabacillus herbersteinensis TaxID=283816 RepID=A0ABV6GET5_9BACI